MSDDDLRLEAIARKGAAAALAAQSGEGAEAAAVPLASKSGAEVVNLQSPKRVIWLAGGMPSFETPVVSVSEPALLSAPGGSGKSYAALAFMLAATGETGLALGLGVRPGPALYVSYEDSYARVGSRLWRIREASPVPVEVDVGAAADNQINRLTVVADSADGDPLPPLFDPDPSVRAGAVEGVGFWRLVKLAESIRPSLIVIDPVSAAAGAVGLNDAVGARAIMRAFARLSVRTDAGVLVLAHDTKAARNDARAGLSPGAGAVGGSGQWFDAARCVLYLHRNRDTGDREIECLKANHGRDGWAVPLAEVKTEAGSFAGYEAAPAGPMLDYEAIRAERRWDADAARKAPKVPAPAEIPAGTAPDDPGDRGWGTGTPA